MKQILLAADVFAETGENWLTAGQWPAQWLVPPGGSRREPGAWACRLRFHLEAAASIRLHLAADERYEFWVDGHFAGRGSERSQPESWAYDSYEMELPAGPHEFTAVIWWLGGAAPRAQMSLGTGFILGAGAPWQDALNTGTAPWESRELPGWSFTRPFAHDFFSVGWNAHYSAGQEPGSWNPAIAGECGSVAGLRNRHAATRLLRPALLPARLENLWRGGTAVALGELGTAPYQVSDQGHGASSTGLQQWTGLLHGESLTIAAGEELRVLFDLQDYLTAYPRLTVSGGRGMKVQLHWAESLFEGAAGEVKGNRSQWRGKRFCGTGDSLTCDGAGSLVLVPPLWRAGRWLELQFSGSREPATLSLELLETGYPLAHSEDSRAGRAEGGEGWPPLLALCDRTMRRSIHDAMIDGPYYEQMAWAGDCLQQGLTSFVMSADDRPVRKALLDFAGSRATFGHHAGLLAARWPARDRLLIAPYNLYWIALLHAQAHWRDDREFVRSLMPVARGILESFLGLLNPHGLLANLPGWNFVDWVPGWASGMPPGDACAPGKPQAIYNWHLAWTLRLAAELEDALGEAELAARWRRLGTALADHCEVFWSEERQLFADGPGSSASSQHVQAFALLSGALSQQRCARLLDSLTASRAGMAGATWGFAHHVAEALALHGQGDRLRELFEPWFHLTERGLFTTPEAPEPSRSDCHGWSAHPLFHFHATVAGIRPASPGFATLRVRPAPGDLPYLRVRTPHPAGLVELEMESSLQNWTVHLHLPAGIRGMLETRTESLELNPGKNRFTLPQDCF